MNEYSIKISDDDPEAPPMGAFIPKQFERHYLGEGRLGDGLRSLHGETGLATLAALDATINALGTNETDDGNKPTEGNARHALVLLHRAASTYPNGVWTVYG